MLEVTEIIIKKELEIAKSISLNNYLHIILYIIMYIILYIKIYKIVSIDLN